MQLVISSLFVQEQKVRGLGFSLFAHRLLRESLTFSFPPGT